jgi:putative hydrolase of the HAD superfamily
MSLLQFKALSIEVVGTLIDAERGMLDYFRHVAPGARVHGEDFLRACRSALASPLARPLPDDLERVWHELAREFGLPRDDAAGFRASIAQWPAFADSVAALKRLQRHYKVVAATNAQRWAIEPLEHTLGLRFDAVVTCDDARRLKPDPRFFVHMKEFLGMQDITRSQTLHIGHSQFHDIRIAQALGWRTCWIERRAPDRECGWIAQKPAKPDWHFRTLRELADAVDAEAQQRRRVAAVMDEDWVAA